MFGILRPCRHSLPGDLADAWMGHLCGLCLALRDGHGQAARVATNYDGLVISVLASAQSEACAETRAAGPCPLRGMRKADVAEGEGARLAAVVSLLLASVKISDHVDDGDGLYGRGGVRDVARKVASRWSEGAVMAGSGLGFDGSVLTAVAERQRDVETVACLGTDLLQVTEPTENATGEAFAHTALLAGRPENAEPLREAGRLFGRVAHLLDAVEDQEADRSSGLWNPLTVTGTSVENARSLCDDAVLGVSMAVDDAVFTDDRLVHALLVHELRRSVDRTFTHAGHPDRHGGRGAHPGYGHYGPPPPPGHQQYGHPGGGHPGHAHPGQGPYGGHYGTGGPYGGGPNKRSDQGCGCVCVCKQPAAWSPPKKRGVLAGCGMALFMCCTCQQCCRDPYPGPWSGEQNDRWCKGGLEVCSGCAEVASWCGNCARCCVCCLD